MKKMLLLVFVILIVVVGFIFLNRSDIKSKTKVNLENYSVATFAGGCFWCVESDFEKLSGVAEVISGYTGGEIVNPSYKQVSGGTTEHLEAVQIYYDPKRVSYDALVRRLLKDIDPTDAKGSFADRGFQYSSAIFYHNEEQKNIAEIEIKKLDEVGVFSKPVVTVVRKLSDFYLAEEYHQNYHIKNPLRYKYYRNGSGRDQFLRSIWESDSGAVKKYLEEAVRKGMGGFNKSSIEELKEKLTPLQYRVTQEDGTEPSYNNEFWDNKKNGIYVDIVSGEPLFSSQDKYDSGTGWPSFTRPISDYSVTEKKDKKLFFTRTEIRSSLADSHLGHVFEDGPEDETGLRYCINSAALRFVPVEDLEKEGYLDYLNLFNY